MIEKNTKLYNKIMRKAKPVLVHQYGEERAAQILRDTMPVYERFLAETPFIGGRENALADNLDMALPFFAMYEATGRTLSQQSIDDMIDGLFVGRCRSLGKFLDANKLDRPWLINAVYRMLQKDADKINARKGKEWNNTWGLLFNPEGHDHGFAMTLVGCPIADFAQKHGYMNLMPAICGSDDVKAKALHARLIRHHTVAEGADSCDYWYVGDQDTSSE